MKFTESQLEQAFISLLEDQGYPHVHGEEIVIEKESELKDKKGFFAYGLDVASLKIEYNSRPRNPKIADACFKSGYIDAWGRGTLKIIEACKEAGLPEPEIIEKDGGVQVTLFKSEGSTMGGTMGGTIVQLTNRQLEVLELINVDNKISIREIAKKLHINVSATQAHLDALKEKGILSREGGTRGFWKILIDN